MAWSPDGQTLVTGAKDGSVKYWDPAASSAVPCVAVPEPVKSWGLAFFPDSQSLLALTESEGAVVRWDTPKAQVKESLAFLGTNHTALDLSPEGRWLALGDCARQVAHG